MINYSNGLYFCTITTNKSLNFQWSLESFPGRRCLDSVWGLKIRWNKMFFALYLIINLIKGRIKNEKRWGFEIKIFNKLNLAIWKLWNCIAACDVNIASKYCCFELVDFCNMRITIFIVHVFLIRLKALSQL